MHLRSKCLALEGILDLSSETLIGGNLAVEVRPLDLNPL